MSVNELPPTPSTPPWALPDGCTPPKKPTKRQIRNAIKILTEAYHIDEENSILIALKQDKVALFLRREIC